MGKLGEMYRKFVKSVTEGPSVAEKKKKKRPQRGGTGMLGQATKKILERKKELESIPE